MSFGPLIKIHLVLVNVVDVTYIQVSVEQNMSERLRLAENGIDQDDNQVIFDVFVHWLLAGLLQTDRQVGSTFN